jgi:hypothetical protein
MSPTCKRSQLGTRWREPVYKWSLRINSYAEAGHESGYHRGNGKQIHDGVQAQHPLPGHLKYECGNAAGEEDAIEREAAEGHEMAIKSCHRRNSFSSLFIVHRVRIPKSPWVMSCAPALFLFVCCSRMAAGNSLVNPFH